MSYSNNKNNMADILLKIKKNCNHANCIDTCTLKYVCNYPNECKDNYVNHHDKCSARNILLDKLIKKNFSRF
jgi:hypothetical protein